MGTIPPGSGACAHPGPASTLTLLAQHHRQAVGNTVLQGLCSRLLSEVHVEASTQRWGFASTWKHKPDQLAYTWQSGPATTALSYTGCFWSKNRWGLPSALWPRWQHEPEAESWRPPWPPPMVTAARGPVQRVGRGIASRWGLAGSLSPLQQSTLPGAGGTLGAAALTGHHRPSVFRKGQGQQCAQPLGLGPLVA